jgi:hypothetical protein
MSSKSSMQFGSSATRSPYRITKQAPFLRHHGAFHAGQVLRNRNKIKLLAETERHRI